MTREPSPAALYAARLARAYHSLSAYSAASLAHELDAIERAQHRHAERCCSGEDGGYVKPGKIDGKDYVFKPGRAMASPCLVHDPEAEARVGERIARRVGRWRDRLCHLATTGQHAPNGIAMAEAQAKVNDGNRVTLQDDPRGRVLLLQLPGEAAPA